MRRSVSGLPVMSHWPVFCPEPVPHRLDASGGKWRDLLSGRLQQRTCAHLALLQFGAFDMMGFRTHYHNMFTGILNILNWWSLRKRQEREGRSDLSALPLYPEAGHKTHVKGALPLLGGVKTFLPPETGNLGPRNLYTQTLLNPYLFSDLLTMEYTPSPNLSALSVLHKLIDSLSKRYKRFLLWSLLWIFILSWRLPC